MDDQIQVQVGEQVVEGRFLWLEPRDMEVEITAPFSGLTTGSHVLIVPARVMVTFLYVTAGELTSRGKSVAERCLRELYEICQIVLADLDAMRQLYSQAQAAERLLPDNVSDPTGQGRRFRELQRLMRSGQFDPREYERQLAAYQNQKHLAKDPYYRVKLRFLKSVEDRFGYTISRCLLDQVLRRVM